VQVVIGTPSGQTAAGCPPGENNFSESDRELEARVLAADAALGIDLETVIGRSNLSRISSST
jgi:hypothetical protein